MYRPETVGGCTTGSAAEAAAECAPFGGQRHAADAGDSPITRRLGSQDQFTVGARLSYSFAITPFWR